MIAHHSMREALPIIRESGVLMGTLTDQINHIYGRCFACPKFLKTCRGKDTQHLPYPLWGEYCRQLAIRLGLSHRHIAIGAKCSESTIHRAIFSLEGKDILRSTAGDITAFLQGDIEDTDCCAVEYELLEEKDKEIASLKQERDALMATLNSLQSAFRDEVSAVKAGHQKNIEHLQDEISYIKAENEKKDKIISRLLEK